MTGLGSLLGTVESNSPTDTPTQSETSVLDSANVDVTIGGQDVAPGIEEFRLPGLRVDFTPSPSLQEVYVPGHLEKQPTVIKEKTSAELVVDMVWARLFDKDLRAGEIVQGDSELQATLNVIELALQQKGEIDRIGVKGSASSEAVTKKTGHGNLDVDDLENKQLAQERAEQVGARLYALVEQRFGKAIADKIVIEEGVEQKDSVLNEALRSLANHRAVDVDTMLARYEANRNLFTRDELKVLDVLAAQRFVAMRVDSHRPVAGFKHVYRDGEWLQVPTQEKEKSLVLVPIIIPMFSLRGRGARSDSGGAVRPERNNGPQGGRRAPREIGVVLQGYSRPAKQNKQPTSLNNGVGNKRGSIRRGSQRGVNRKGRQSR